MKSKKIKNYVYTGVLAPVINKHIEEKRAMGLLYNTDAKILLNFDKFTLMYSDAEPNVLSESLVKEYIKKRPNEGTKYQTMRMYAISRLAEYMIRIGMKAYVIPGSSYPRIQNLFKPYIFTDDEINRIFQAADSMKSHPHNRNVGNVAPVLFRLLYSCGMRISEVIGLTLNDVDIENGIIRIDNAKFEKSRYIPMSESMTNICRTYVKEMFHSERPETSAFFPNTYNNFYSPTAIYTLYREILRRAGISHGGKCKGPRIHDFRHTFAVHCLRNWSKTNCDITTAFPYLSSYLGHTDLYATQKYLRLTADVYPQLIERLEDKYGDIFPKLKGDVSNAEL